MTRKGYRVHCINGSRENAASRFLHLAQKLKEKDRRIGYAHCSDPTKTATKNTKYGEFVVGSPLSFQLAVNELNIKFITNIPSNDRVSYSNQPHVHLPLVFHSEEHSAYPRDWLFEKTSEEHEIILLKSLMVSHDDSHKIENETIKQSKCEKWHQYRKNRVTSSKAYMVYTRKRHFESLVNSLQDAKPKSELPQTVQDAMNHGIIYEPIAREKYFNILKYELRRDVNIRETGLVIQPNLFWVAASPDGMVIDSQIGVGLIEIKCPKSKRSVSPDALVNDKKFYMTLENGMPALKKNHKYYTQIQIAMGLSGVLFCDFVVYTFGGLIIARTDFDHNYFISVMGKINSFFRKYMLPALVHVPRMSATVDDNESICD